jgi:hypothetical protein
MGLIESKKKRKIFVNLHCNNMEMLYNLLKTYDIVNNNFIIDDQCFILYNKNNKIIFNTNIGFSESKRFRVCDLHIILIDKNDDTKYYEKIINKINKHKDQKILVLVNIVADLNYDKYKYYSKIEHYTVNIKNNIKLGGLSKKIVDVYFKNVLRKPFIKKEEIKIDIIK